MSRRLSGNDGPGRPARSPRSPETERKGRARCVLQPHPRGSVPRRAEGRTQAPGALGLTVRSARLTRAGRKRLSARGCWPASEEPGQEREDDHDRGTDEDRWPAIVGHLADEEQGFTDRDDERDRDRHRENRDDQCENEVAAHPVSSHRSAQPAVGQRRARHWSEYAPGGAAGQVVALPVRPAADCTARWGVTISGWRSPRGDGHCGHARVALRLGEFGEGIRRAEGERRSERRWIERRATTVSRSRV